MRRREDNVGISTMTKHSPLIWIVVSNQVTQMGTETVAHHHPVHFIRRRHSSRFESMELYSSDAKQRTKHRRDDDTTDLPRTFSGRAMNDFVHFSPWIP